jgi:uncharacterized phage protein (TIGR01671 family)
MQNRYLFKAKRKDNGEWVEGFYFCMTHTDGRHTHHFIIPLGADLSLGTPVEKIQVEVDQSTICQCTGLKDKNGNLIWENDIVKDLFSDVCAQIKYGSYQNCFDSTKTEHVGFYVCWSDKYTKRYRKDLGYWINMVDAKIVGSKIDNPELLEVQK